MDIKGILFDKDGTLLEFFKTWIPVAREVIDLLIDRYQLPPSYRNKMAESIGLFADDTIDPDGSLSAGTNRDVADDIIKAAPELAATDYATEYANIFTRVAKKRTLYPVDDMLPTLKVLKKKGLKMGISTADNIESAENFLKVTGARKYFDFIGADDGIMEPKPAPTYMRIFCERFSLSPEEVAVIGDTLTDMQFGKNAGAGLIIGVLTGTGTREELSPASHMVLPSIADVIDSHGKLVWSDFNGQG